MDCTTVGSANVDCNESGEMLQRMFILL